MGILLLILSFIAIFLNFLLSHNKTEGISYASRLSFVKASVVVALLIVFFTESLSFFDAITAVNVRLLWLIVLITNSVYLYVILRKNRNLFQKINFKRICFLKKESWSLKIVVLMLLMLILSLFIISFTITNNWDSYTYHLPKVEHWIQDKNVDFFPTNIVRQLYLAPFAEYFMLNVRLLSGNVLFLNFVQFFSMINSLLLVSLIAKYFKLDYKGQIGSIIVAATIPMGFLQAVTTQTDYVASFFLVTFLFFGLLIIKESKISFENIAFFCLSFSLGILTKSTFYVFALPFCFMFGAYFVKLFKFRSFYITLSLILVFFLVNASFLCRNFQQFGSPLGPQKSSPYYIANLNKNFGIKETLSNGIRNVGLHLALPSDYYNKNITSSIEKFHRIIRYPFNSNQTTWSNTEYATVFSLNHDTTGNFFHIILFFISIGFIFIKFKHVDRTVVFYAVSILFGFILFAFLLRWQPWQTRLDLPLFVCLSPLIALFLNSLKLKRIKYFIYILLLSGALVVVLFFDPMKTIFGKNSVFSKGGSSYVFNYSVANKVESKLKKNKIYNVGLVLGVDSFEWQYWLISKNRRFEYVYFHNDFLSTPNFHNDFKYSALIIENSYLNSLPQSLKVNEFIANKDDISEISNINDKISLVIYKTAQDKIITYK